MIDATVLLLTFTDQHRFGFSGKQGIELNCRTDVDVNWRDSLYPNFSRVLCYDIYGGANAAGVCGANAEILHIAETYRPRYVVYPCNFSGIVTEETLSALRKLGSIVVAHFFDDEVYFDARSRWVIPFVDYCVTPARRRLEDYERLGARPIFSAAIPLSSAIFAKLDHVQKAFDVSFVGGLHANRAQYLSAISANGISVENFGGRGTTDKIHYADMAKIINQSRINLSFSLNTNFGPGKQQLKGRMFEVPLCGGFLLTEHAVDLEQYFEIGREIVCFDSAKEASEKIRYFLQNSGEREKIAARGYERAQREYRGEIMVRKIFDQIEEDLRQNGRPDPPAALEGVNPMRQADAVSYQQWMKTLLRSQLPLRKEWRATAELVLRTDASNQEAKRLLSRADRWGDPEPFPEIRVATRWIKGRLARFTNAVRSKIAWRWFKLRRFITNALRGSMHSYYDSNPVPLGVLSRLNTVAQFVSGQSSPLLPVNERIDLDSTHITNSSVRAALQNQTFSNWNLDIATLNWVSDYIVEKRIRYILEFGSGLSTLTWAVLCQEHGAKPGSSPHILSIEQDAEWAAWTQQTLKNLKLDHLAEVLHCPLKNREVDGKVYLAYDWNAVRMNSGWRSDLIFVDGPAAGDLSRALAVIDGLPFAKPECVVLMDDALRHDEICCTQYLQAHGYVDFQGIVPVGKGLALGKVASD